MSQGERTNDASCALDILGKPGIPHDLAVGWCVDEIRTQLGWEVTGGTGLMMSSRPMAGVLLPLVLFLFVGFTGLDFGGHWDEHQSFLRPMRKAVEQDSILPGRYNYPSLGFALTMAALLPERIRGEDYRESVLALLPPAAKDQAKRDLQREGPSKAFLLRLRGLFLVVGALALVWVHRCVLDRGGSGLEAVFASSLLGLSFEVAYHLRWAAPDGLLMQCAALCLMCCMRSVKGGAGLRWLALGAVAAGLGCGSKYPGGLLLVPVGVACLYHGWAGGGGVTLKTARSGGYVLVCLVIFAAVFVATTPGILLDSDLFWADLKYERRHYTEVGHGLHTIAAGFEHTHLILRYLVFQAFSYSPMVSALLIGLSVVGAVHLCRTQPWQAGILLVMPVLYVGYMSSVIVFLVRNLLVLMPFLAVLAAHGMTVVFRRVPVAKRRGAIAGLLAILYGLNGTMLVSGAWEIHQHGPELADDPGYVQALQEHALAKLARDLRSVPNERIYVTPSVHAALRNGDYLQGLDHLCDDWDEAVESVVAQRDEFTASTPMKWGFFPGFVREYGLPTINFDYYPTWEAGRVLWMDRQNLEGHGLSLVTLGPLQQGRK